MALIAYEQENGNVVTFTVSVKALPRILGKAGSQVNQIKEDTGVQSVDVDQQGDEATSATVTLRGTKSGTKKAREAIEAIAKEVDNEARFTIQIPREYHTTLIGSGGSSIRELIAKAGGPTDSRLSGNTVRFPRQGDGADNVTITAPKAVAEKIRAALEKEVESLKSRIVFGVAVPQSQHASIIGKGASAVQELQRKHGVKITMPSWNEYAQAGEISNPEDVKDVAESDIIKVVGPREAAVAAAADLSVRFASSRIRRPQLTSLHLAEGAPCCSFSFQDHLRPYQVPRQDRSRWTLLPVPPQRHSRHPRRPEAPFVERQEQEASYLQRRLECTRCPHRR